MTIIIEEYADVASFGQERVPVLGRFIKKQTITPSGSAQTSATALDAAARAIAVYSDSAAGIAIFQSPGADASNPTAATAAARRSLTPGAWRTFSVAGGEKISYITE